MTEQPVLPVDQPAEPVAPADLVAPHTLRARLVWYVGSMVLSLVLIVLAFQLWKRDLRAPFYYDLDSMLYLPLVRTTIETGSHWENPRLGAPGQQELYDFPIIDFVHFKFLWLIGRFTSEVLFVYHIYSLLTYPLTVLTSMWVLRWLKLSLPASAVGALLYAFQPFHQERYHYHYFLAAYWWVPVSIVPALALCKGALPFFATRADGSRRWNLLSWVSVWWVALGAVTAAAGAYYAFFACALIAFAGAYAWLVYRTWRGAASAGLLLLPVVAAGILLHLPTFLYQSKYGVNPLTERQPEEADNYGLKIAHLLLPTTDHSFGAFAKLRTKYNTPNRQAEGERAASLGVIGGAGFVALLALALLPFRKQWPAGPLSALVLYLVFLGSIGAFGSIFNLIVTPQIRAYNRIVVFIGFLSVAAAFWWVDRFSLTRTGRWTRRLRAPALGLLLLVGCFDQLPWGLNPFNWEGRRELDLFAQRYQADKRFFKRVEEAMRNEEGAPTVTRVYCLPYVACPESPALFQMPSYEHARGAVMTDHLHLSYGAIKGRETDMWQRDVNDWLPVAPERVLERIVARGFDGLFVDGRGFPPGRNPDKVAELIDRVHKRYQAEVGNAQATLPVIPHEDGRQFFLDLRPFRKVWGAKKPAEYAAAEKYEREWVATVWTDGFVVAAALEPGGERWFLGPASGTFVLKRLVGIGPTYCAFTLVNPTDRTRTFELSFNIGVVTPGPFEVQFSGLLNDSFALDKDESGDPRKLVTLKKYERLELPPGRSTVRVRCIPPSHYQPADGRSACFLIKDYKLVEVK